MQFAVRAAILVWLAGVPAPAAELPPFRHVPLNVADGCFVEAVAFCDAVKEQFGADAWSRVLQWGAREDDEIVAGHAVAVFAHRGRLWVWDINFGYTSLEIEPDQKEDVAAVALPITANYANLTVRHPLYRHDFPQQAAASPPDERPLAVEPAVRDASRVAARLGRHRPVNLVEFTYPKDGGTQVSAACVFIFHGRLCVYVPGHGTVPFRARALSVENLRQLQEALRSIQPGAVVRVGGS